MKVIDLSKPIQFNKGDPHFMQVRIRHKPHRAAKLLVWLLGLPARLFPRDFVGWADDTITKMGVHSTTHIDAPWHYGPTSGGARAQTIDEMPLEKCIGPGVVLDLTHKADDDAITPADLEAALVKTGATLNEHTIVLIRTGRDKLMGTKEFWKTRHRHERGGDRMAARPRPHRHGHRPVGMGFAVPRANRPFERRRTTTRCSGRRTASASGAPIGTWSSSPTSARCRRTASR